MYQFIASQVLAEDVEATIFDKIISNINRESFKKSVSDLEGKAKAKKILIDNMIPFILNAAQNLSSTLVEESTLNFEFNTVDYAEFLSDCLKRFKYDRVITAIFETLEKEEQLNERIPKIKKIKPRS